MNESALRYHGLLIALLLLVVPLFVNAEPHFPAYYQIYIENQPGGRVLLNRDGLESVLGKVIQPAEAPDYFPFAAATFGQDSAIVATAVNSIHIRIAPGKTLSILPREVREFGVGNIKTDIPAGSALFLEHAPRVGDSVRLLQADGVLCPLPSDYIPVRGDCWVIFCSLRRDPSRIVLENQAGGSIWMENESSQVVIGKVLHPVSGSGRFEGSQYALPGTVRANHPGVICISTSLPGVVGGFQIVPRDHLEAHGLQRYLGAPQWMTVEGEQVKAGCAPLFSGMLRPGDRVYCETADGAIRDLPLTQGREDEAFNQDTDACRVKKIIIELMKARFQLSPE